MTVSGTPSGPKLQRALGLPLLVFYGLGTIVGAGIYVLVGEVVGLAGNAAPLAFLAAGLLAALTGLSYAELAARHPEAAGAAAYVHAAFRSPALSSATGFATVAAAVLTTASVAHGATGYIAEFVPLPSAVGAGLVVVLFTAIACLGVRQSVASAALMTVIEIGGLLAVAGLGTTLIGAASGESRNLLPDGAASWGGVPVAIFLAFFAFIGFESLSNMAEETRDVGRTLPRAILLSIAVATLLYVVVVGVAVLVVPAAELGASSAPLCTIVERTGIPCEPAFSGVALIAIGNGVLIEILTVARLLYGMARRRLAPAGLAAVAGTTRVPARATLLAGAVVLACALFASFDALVRLSSGLILLVFAAVNLALMRLHRREPRADLSIRAPRWVPPLGALSSLLLIGAWLFG